MTLSEWLLFIAIIDGPLIGILYLIIQRLRNEIRQRN